MEIADSDDHESKSSILSSQFSSHDRDSDSLRLRLSKIKKVKKLVNTCFVKKIPFTERYVEISNRLATNTNTVLDRELDDLECECVESLSLEKEVSDSSSNSEHSPNGKSSHYRRRKKDIQQESRTLMQHSHPPYSPHTPYDMCYTIDSSYNTYQPRRQENSRRHSGGGVRYRAATPYYPHAQPQHHAHHYSFSSEREQPPRGYQYGETISGGGSMRYSQQDMYSTYDHLNSAPPMSSSPIPNCRPFQTTQQLPSFDKLSQQSDTVHLSRGSSPDTASASVYSDTQYTYQPKLPTAPKQSKYSFIHSELVSSTFFFILTRFVFRITLHFEKTLFCNIS